MFFYKPNNGKNVSLSLTELLKLNTRNTFVYFHKPRQSSRKITIFVDEKYTLYVHCMIKAHLNRMIRNGNGSVEYILTFQL